VICLVFGICDLLFFNCLYETSSVSFSIKLAAFQASGGAET
jgi:hypothetical protein